MPEKYGIRIEEARRRREHSSPTRHHLTGQHVRRLHPALKTGSTFLSRVWGSGVPHTQSMPSHCLSSQALTCKAPGSNLEPHSSGAVQG